jgi:hypothetical protein
MPFSALQARPGSRPALSAYKEVSRRNVRRLIRVLWAVLLIIIPRARGGAFSKGFQVSSGPAFVFDPVYFHYPFTVQR